MDVVERWGGGGGGWNHGGDTGLQGRIRTKKAFLEIQIWVTNT